MDGKMREEQKDTAGETEGTALAEGETLSASLEDYVEAILQLERTSRVARVSEIAAQLEVSRPSVTGALKVLRARGLVSHAPYGHVTLTEEGTRIATEVERRHVLIRDFLTGVLSLPQDKAEVTACRLEHVLEADVLDHFVSYSEKLDAADGEAAEGDAADGEAAADPKEKR
jgi:DtxR family Mn-dependent transcriptional regulator